MCLSTPAFHGSLWNGCLCGVSCFKTCQGIPSEDYWAFWILFFLLFSLYWHIEPPSTLQLSSLGCNQHSKHIRKCLAAASRVIFRRFTPEIYTQLFYISSWYVSLFWHLAWTIKKNALINMQSALLELFLQPCCHVNPSLLRWTVSWKASLVFPEESKEI